MLYCTDRLNNSFGPLVVVDEPISPRRFLRQASTLAAQDASAANATIDKERAEQLQRAEPLVIHNRIDTKHCLGLPKSFPWLQTRAMQRKARARSSNCTRRR